MKKITVLLFAVTFALQGLAQQNKDKALYQEYKPGFYENDILKGVDEFNRQSETPKPVRQRFKADLSALKIPNDYTAYKTVWYNNPISQGNTSTCWCYAGTSFYESEAYRLSKQQVKLSEMWTVYWEYVERAKYFVKERGNMFFGEGSETNAVTRAYSLHGAVPMELYTGLKNGQTYHTHTKMFAELDAYLKKVKELNAWDETTVVNTVKSILNYYLGEPPSVVKVNGKDLTPQEYLKNYLKINTNDYVDFMSLMSATYYKKAEYKVGDNWWKSSDYYNVPLNDFNAIIQNAIKNGYTIAIGGDVSEPGFDPSTQAAIVPTFDVPADYIDESARQLRFNNGSTTDDHAMHIVGYTEQDGQIWYLVKDSGSGSRNCSKDSKCFGHYFMREDYIKLKIMSLTIHKDAVKNVLSKF